MFFPRFNGSAYTSQLCGESTTVLYCLCIEATFPNSGMYGLYFYLTHTHTSTRLLCRNRHATYKTDGGRNFTPPRYIPAIFSEVGGIFNSRPNIVGTAVLYFRAGHTESRSDLLYTYRTVSYISGDIKRSFMWRIKTSRHPPAP